MMINNMKLSDIAQKLTNLRSNIRVAEEKLTKERVKIEQALIQQIESLKKLQDRETELKDELLGQMKKESIGSVKTDLESIILTTRTDIKVIDTELFTATVKSEASHLKQYLKEKVKTVAELIEYIFPPSLSASRAKELLKNVEAIEGNVLPGAEKVVSEYLTIKQL